MIVRVYDPDFKSLLVQYLKPEHCDYDTLLIFQTEMIIADLTYNYELQPDLIVL